MPTGYTSKITKTMPLEEFAYICARAMGACISMRDDPIDAKIPERFESSSFYQKSLADAEVRLVRLQGLSHDEIEAEAEKTHAEKVALADEMERERLETLAGYERMLKLVMDWTPPTPEHHNLKKFMREQISGSIDFDCGHEWKANEALTPTEWHAKALQDAARSVERSGKNAKREVESADGRTAWIQSLRDCFKKEVRCEREV